MLCGFAFQRVMLKLRCLFNNFGFLLVIVCSLIACAGQQHRPHTHADNIPYHVHLEQELADNIFGSGLALTKSGDELLIDMPINTLFNAEDDDLLSTAFIVLNAIADTLGQFQDTHIKLSIKNEAEGKQEQVVQRLRNLKHYFIARRISARRIHISEECCTQAAGQESVVQIELVDGKSILH